MVILIVALTGFLAGFLSLQIMHGLARRRWGGTAGWLFVAGASGLAGFGGALLPYLLPPRTWRAAKELEKLRVSATQGGAFVGITLRF